MTTNVTTQMTTYFSDLHEPSITRSDHILPVQMTFMVIIEEKKWSG